MKIFRLRTYLLAGAFSLIGSLTFAGGVQVRNPDAGQTIPGLSFFEDKATFRAAPGDRSSEVWLRLPGRYDGKGGNLVWRRTTLEPDSSSGNFEVFFPLVKNPQNEHFAAVATDGGLSLQTVEISARDLAAMKATVHAAAQRRFEGSLGLGLSSIHYVDTKTPSYHELAVTAKGQVGYFLVPARWEIVASGYFTLFPISRNSPETVRFLGLNGRVGYTFTDLLNPWQFSLFGGVNFLTMFVSPPDFGYRRMIGPEVYPVVKRKFKSGNSATAYFKYSPVGSSLSSFNFANYEIAFGGGYLFKLGGGGSIGPTLDVAFQNLAIQSVTVDSSSATLGVSYSF